MNSKELTKFMEKHGLSVKVVMAKEYANQFYFEFLSNKDWKETDRILLSIMDELKNFQFGVVVGSETYMCRFYK